MRFFLVAAIGMFLFGCSSGHDKNVRDVQEAGDVMMDTGQPGDDGVSSALFDADTSETQGPWTLPKGYEVPDDKVAVTEQGVSVSISRDCQMSISRDLGTRKLTVLSNGPLFAIERATKKLKKAFYIDPFQPFYPMATSVCDHVLGWKAIDHGWSVYAATADSDVMRMDCTLDGQTRVHCAIKPAKTGDFQVISLRFKAMPKENYYGLGEFFDHTAQRGQRRPMQMELDPSQESGVSDTHFPIPFFISTRGYGLFVDSFLPGVFDMAAKDEQTIEAAFEDKSLEFYVFLRDKPMDCLDDYTGLTGRPVVPAKWAFGPHLWRNENRDQAQVIADARAARDNNCPFSVLWIDNPWQTAYNNHIFDPKKFPNPKQMIDQLHDLGFRLVVWSTPYIEKAVGDAYDQALAKGYLLTKDPFSKFGKLTDLTNPGAVKLFQGLIRNATDLGVEGFKLDYAEDVFAGLAGGTMYFGFSNGMSNKEMHSRYQLFYHRTYAALLPDDHGFMLTRSGAIGDQVYTSCVWPGDLCDGFQVRGEKEGDTVHTGGLPAAVVAGLSVGTSGFPFYGSDVGGFRHARPDKKPFIRWTEYAALGTIMQVGGGGENHLPWDFTAYGSSQFDEETLNIFRKFAQLHTRLFPYIYTYAQMAHETGRCVTCPLGLYFPDLGKHPDYDFMLGDWMLVAPVVTAKDSRHVVLPAGTWKSFTGDVITGPKEMDVDVPLDEVPLFTRAGAIIPMLDPNIQTLAPAKDVRSFANDPGVLFVHLLPASDTDSAFRLFDDGTRITMKGSTGKVTVTVDKAKLFKGYIMRLDLSLFGLEGLAINMPASFTEVTRVLPGSCTDCFHFDASKGELSVQLGPRGGKFTVGIAHNSEN